MFTIFALALVLRVDLMTSISTAILSLKIRDVLLVLSYKDLSPCSIKSSSIKSRHTFSLDLEVEAFIDE